MIQAYIGDGKGKTTASIGLMIRALGSGKNVALVAFDKGSKTYNHSEYIIFDRLNIKYYVTGKERMLPDGTFRFQTNEEDKKEALRGIKIAKELCLNKNIDVLVLDEILSAVTYGLIEKNEVYDFISIIPKNLEVIMTGRYEDSVLLNQLDLVTSMTKIKHYFDKGVQARKGIEY